MSRCHSALEALSDLKPQSRVFVHGGAAAPRALLNALESNAEKFKELELIHLHVEGPASYAEPRFKEYFKVVNLFVSAPMRPFMDYDRIDYLPCFLSEIPALFRSARRPLDAALLHVSPPDAHGFCSLGTSVDVAASAAANAKLLIAQINPNMPRVHGDGFIHISRIHKWVEVTDPLPEPKAHSLTETDLKIGKNVADLLEDGSTIQVGIGSIPDAVLASLKNHRKLGIHTEMWSDRLLDLIECGAVDNSEKRVHRGKSVSTFLMGSRRLYDFVHDNPSVIQLGADYVNNPTTIARNPKVAAINSAVEIDLTGQICADSVGSSIISGVGGQMDFIRGASLSAGGKPIIAVSSRSISSRTGKTHSRIVPTLKTGAGVVTTRAHVHFVVTEYGVADLYAKTLGERAKSLIAIAHPDDREGLTRQWSALRSKT